jgi:magnesium transporter
MARIEASMLQVYTVRDGTIVAEIPDAAAALPERPLWLDLLEPTAEEQARVEAFARIAMPTLEEMREIETSSRLYRDGNALVMIASILNRAETPHPETRAIAFILVEGTLITVRHCAPQPFRVFPSRLSADPALAVNAEAALVGLLDAIVDRIADTLEMVDATVGELSRTIFEPIEGGMTQSRDYTGALKALGLNAIRCSKVDESLVGLSRLLIFLDAALRLVGLKTVRARIKDLQRDIQSLATYVERLSEKLQLLLDATLGMINIQQNAIIKIFSVVAVVFLPPTLIASIYGMNFEVMPELSWKLGYPLALALMLASAVLPYWLFKRRGWL